MANGRPKDHDPSASLPGGLRGDAGSNPARSTPLPAEKLVQPVEKKKSKALNGLDFIAIRVVRRAHRRDPHKMQALLGLMDMLKTMAKEELDLDLTVDIIIQPQIQTIPKPKKSNIALQDKTVVGLDGKPLKK